MSTNILHVMAPSIYDEIGAVAGDVFALRSLRCAIDEAIETGTGGALFCQSDGTEYLLPVVRADDMAGVNTAYRETKPRRTQGEAIPMTAIPHFMDALAKAWPMNNEGNYVRLSLLKAET